MLNFFKNPFIMYPFQKFILIQNDQLKKVVYDTDVAKIKVFWITLVHQHVLC